MNCENSSVHAEQDSPRGQSANTIQIKCPRKFLKKNKPDVLTVRVSESARVDRCQTTTAVMDHRGGLGILPHGAIRSFQSNHFRNMQRTWRTFSLQFRWTRVHRDTVQRLEHAFDRLQRRHRRVPEMKNIKLCVRHGRVTKLACSDDVLLRREACG